ncbi:MAG: hypothetical protein V7636_1520, partial [Actinomycetota bacterium]
RPDWFVALDPGQIRSWLTTTAAGDDVFTFVADDSGHVIGYALATLHRRPATPFTRALTILEMDQIGVDADARRRGVGTVLINRVADQASELGADLMMLTVWDFNEVARAAFSSRGFVDAMHRMELPSQT